MNAKVAAVSRRTFAALRFRNYRLYFFAQIVSLSGTWMQMIAQSWLVLEITGSGTALGTVLAMQFLPTLLLGPAGGLIADRVDKRKLLIMTQLFGAMLAVTLATVTLTGVVELWMVYVLAAGFGLFTAIDNPTRQTFVMEMVGPDDVSNAVTLNSVVVNGARVIGPAIGGIIIATLGVGTCFLLNAFTFLAMIGAMARIRVSDLHRSERAARGRGQLREGFHYAWSTPELRTTLLMLVLIGTLTYEFQVTLPMLSEFTFGAGAGGLATMTALMGAGAVVGGLVTAASGNPTPQRFVLMAAAFGVVVIAVSLMPTITLVYLLMPFVGAASVSVIALSNATLQLNSSPALRGRVMALFAVAMLGSTPIGGPIVGVVGEHVDPRAAVGIGGIAALAAAAFGWSQLRRPEVVAGTAPAPPQAAHSTVA